MCLNTCEKILISVQKRRPQKTRGLPQWRRAQYIAQNTLIYTCQKTYVLKKEKYRIDARPSRDGAGSLGRDSSPKTPMYILVNRDLHTRKRVVENRRKDYLDGASGAIRDKTDLF